MSQAVLNLIAKKALKNAAITNTNSKDPYFVEEKHTDKHGRTTVKKVRRPIPQNLSAHDAKILKTVRKRAYRLDCAVNLCGFKLGWGSIIGLIPAIGDVIDCLMAFFFVYRKAAQIEGGLPAAIQSRMLLNIAMDFAVGLVPFLGDIADALFKANSRNAWVLEEYLVKKAQLQQEGALNNEAKAERILEKPAPSRARTGDGHHDDDVELGLADHTHASSRR